MPSTFEQLNPTRVKLTIDMPFAELEPAIAEAYKEIARQVTIPGFRKGKVPPRLIDQRFGRGVVLQEAINHVLPATYGAAITEHELRPLGEPEIDLVELNDGSNVLFTAEVDVRPEFELPDASTIKVEVDRLAVSDETVNERVDMLRERFATLTDEDRAVQAGDMVTINLVARKDGAVLSDAEATDLQYKVGSGQMLDGLDDALTGMQVGETKTFNSELVGGPHRGVEAEVEVTLHKVQSQKLPVVDDEFAQLVSEFDTAAEMLADLTDNLTRMTRLTQVGQGREKVLRALAGRADFELPEALVSSEQAARRENIEQQLTRAGLTLEQYLADNDDEPDTPDEFWAEVNGRVVEALRSQIILDKYAEEHGLEVSQQEFTELILARAAQNNTTPEHEVQHMMEHGHTAAWMAEAKRSKALAELFGAATIVDTDGNVLELSLVQSDGTLAEPEPHAEPGPQPKDTAGAKAKDDKPAETDESGEE